MAWCLPPEFAKKVKESIRKGEFSTEKFNTDSATRRSMLEKIVGKENAQEVNLMYEKSLLLKNQERAMFDFVRKITGLSKAEKEATLAKIRETYATKKERIFEPREQENFLNEVAADIYTRKFRTDVTLKEAQKITEDTARVNELKAKIPADDPIGSPARLKYGAELIASQEYVRQLKVDANVTKGTDYVVEASGAAKSFKATFDNSFFGRQGQKMFYRNPVDWTYKFAKSFPDIVREIRGIDTTAAVKVDGFSRPNALNGKYKKMEIDVDILGEEAFPSELPAKIPAFGRVHRASQAAFNNAALRFRFDYADKLIKQMEKQGIDTTDAFQMKAVGEEINSMTGRGSIGKLEVIGKEINATLFSVKFLKANVNTLLRPFFGKTTTPFSRHVARQNLIRIIGGIAAVNFVAEMMNPGSQEFDPRGSHFGKVATPDGKTFNHSAGLGSLVTLASRLVPTMHDGEWGFWTKNSKTGIYSKLNDASFGKDDAVDMFENFWEGKLSPLAGVLRDHWAGRTYTGEKPDIGTTIKGLTVPISIEQFMDLMEDPSEDNVAVPMLLEMLGYNLGTPYKTNWETSTSQELKQFNEQVGDKVFKEANDEYNRLYNEWFLQYQNDERFTNLSDENKQKLITSKKSEIKGDIFWKYNFTPEKSTPTDLPYLP
uniref:Uncharacterized protein n=1 Tax=viral metagenome TaxID=1070528 RepID=A0A6M3Y4X1_9ZZZZ